MSQRKVIFSPDAPTPIGTYSQAVVGTNNVLYLSGQVGTNNQTGDLVSSSFADQARQAFTNMKAVVQAAGGTLDQVVKVNIFITSFGNFADVNTVMGEFFREPYPARSTIGAASLPKDAAIEIEGIVQL